MKALFVGDLQLEAGIDLGYGEFGDGSRFDDQLRMLDWIATHAGEEGATLVVVLGDVFERAKPSPWAILGFQGFVRRLEEQQITTLVVAGNHDIRSPALPSALSIFDGGRIRVSLTPDIYAFDGITIATLPWAPISKLVTADALNRPREELYELAARGLAHAAAGLKARAHDHLLPSVLVGHWALSGASLPTGLSTMLLREPLVPTDTLSVLGYDLVIFGHIHEPQTLGLKEYGMHCLHAGSAWVNNWGEANMAHGCWTFDTESRTLTFKPIPDRAFITSDLTPEQALDPKSLDFVDDLLGSVVRVRYQASEAEARLISNDEIRREFLGAGARKVVIRPEVFREARERAPGLTSALDPESAFQHWLDSQGYLPEEWCDLLDLHREFLKALS